jgi:hypothetical protein
MHPEGLNAVQLLQEHKVEWPTPESVSVVMECLNVVCTPPKTGGPCSYLSGAKYLTTLVIAPANISLLNGVCVLLFVPLIAVARF